jgi:hypothetical protein
MLLITLLIACSTAQSFYDRVYTYDNVACTGNPNGILTGNNASVSSPLSACVETTCTNGYKIECGVVANGTAPASANCGIDSYSTAGGCAAGNDVLVGTRVTIGACHNINQAALSISFRFAIAGACASDGFPTTAMSFRPTSCLGASIAQQPGSFQGTCYAGPDCQARFTTTTIATTTMVTNATTTIQTTTPMLLQCEVCNAPGVNSAPSSYSYCTAATTTNGGTTTTSSTTTSSTTTPAAGALSARAIVGITVAALVGTVLL